MLYVPRSASHGPARGRAHRAHACCAARRTCCRARIQSRRSHHRVSGNNSIIYTYTPSIPHLPFRLSLHHWCPDRVYGLLQDGPAAGQTLSRHSHVHFHLLPRRLQGDRFIGSQPDAVYVELEKREGVLPQDLAASSGSQVNTDTRSPELLGMDADSDREPRMLEDMEQ